VAGESAPCVFFVKYRVVERKRGMGKTKRMNRGVAEGHGGRRRGETKLTTEGTESTEDAVGVEDSEDNVSPKG